MTPDVRRSRASVLRSIQSTVTGRVFQATAFSAALASVAVGCGKAHPPLTVSAVRQKLAADGFRTYVQAPADVFSIPRCGHPITAVIAGGEQQHGLASVFLCADENAARAARVPPGDEMPGTRVRRGRYFVIVNRDARLRRWLIATLTNRSH
jgi:hypothetical protein